MDKKITITKVGEITKKEVKTAKRPLKSILKKTFKLKGVKDPSVTKGMQKHTLRILTEKGIRKRNRKTRRNLDKMSNEKIREIAKKGGLTLNPNTPPHIAKEILDNASSAGFLST